jgi:hypothetical protein
MIPYPTRFPASPRRRLALRAIAVAALFGPCTGGAAASTDSDRSVGGIPWRDTPVARLEALALIETLNAELLASTSATRTLERWCGEHALADSPRIVAHRLAATADPGALSEAEAAVRADLKAPQPVALRYRRVELACGQRVLSVAENWYVPSRLTAAMNRQLDDTQTPFGIVVQSLEVHRQTLAARLLWSPLPPGWERTGLGAAGPAGGYLAPPSALFEHRALVVSGSNVPIAEVHEVYQSALLDFPEPAGAAGAASR